MDTFLEEVVAGLSSDPKTLPCKYFYDARGSELFEAICGLEEYYVTRTELAIMRSSAQEIAAHVGSRVRIVEFGSGSGIKTQILLDALDAPVTYVPIEISREPLEASAAQLRSRHPDLEVVPLCADYTAPITIAASDVRTVVYFPGSTIGNFHPHDALTFLSRMKTIAGDGGAILIGVDCEKDAAVLERAYDDARGITAAFNLNLLQRINSELITGDSSTGDAINSGGGFDIAQFRHRAVYNLARHRIEMHLVSDCQQSVTIGGRTFDFAADEFILSEVSYKYSTQRFSGLAVEAGLKVVKTWTDSDGAFGLHYLEPA